MSAEKTTHRPSKSDTQRRLDRLLFWQRLRVGLIAGAALAGAIAVFVFLAYEQTANLDKVVKSRELGGIVTGAKRGYSRRAGYSVSIRLDRGGDISAVSRLAVVPVKGEHVRVKEALHASGNKTYSVRELLP